MGDTTYDFQDQVRDVSPVLDIIMKDSPTLFSLIGDSAEDAQSTKHEYLSDALNSYRDPVAGTFATGDTTLNVTDGTKFRVNDILGFEEDTGEAFLETIRVTDITGNVLTVTRQYNSLTKVQVAANDIVKIVSRPNVENTIGGVDEAQDRVDRYNYTEIFIKFAQVSATQQRVKTHGVGNELDHQVMLRLQEKLLQYERALIFGFKSAGSKTIPRTAGGILSEILSDSAALKKDVNGALAAADIDDAVEDILTASGLNPDIIVCHPKGAKKISAFDTSGIKVERSDPVTGRAVFAFQSSIPIGNLQRILVVPQFPKDMALVLNSSKIKRTWLRRLIDMDATQKGQDGFARKMVSELTFEFRNADVCHKLLYNFNL